MMSKDEVFKVVEQMGLRPEQDSDGDIVFCYQMKPIIIILNNDEPYMSVMLYQFHEIDEGEDTKVLAACNLATRKLKLAKVYVDESYKNVTAVCESFYTDEQSLEQNLRRSLGALGIVMSVFRKTLMEFEE